MGWFALGRRPRIAVRWRYEVNGILWRLLPSAEGYLVLEDRNVEQKSVTFACLDRRSGTAIWKDARFDQTWWISIDAVYRDMLFLHEYAAPDLPEQKKIVAVDLRTGTLRWVDDTVKLLFLHDQSVYVCRDDQRERRFFELDMRTGAVRREIDEHALSHLRTTAASPSAGDLRLPHVHDGGGIVEEAIERATKAPGLLRFTEFLDAGDYLVIGYYEQRGASQQMQAMRQHLVVYNRTAKNIDFRDIVAEEAALAVPETFFTIGSFVYYIKNNRILTALDLGL